MKSRWGWSESTHFRYGTVSYHSTGISVADAHHVGSDLESDPAFHFDADPDPACHFYADPDPTFQFDADPDPALALGF